MFNELNFSSLEKFLTVFPSTIDGENRNFPSCQSARININRRIHFRLSGTTKQGKPGENSEKLSDCADVKLRAFQLVARIILAAVITSN